MTAISTVDKSDMTSNIRKDGTVKFVYTVDHNITVPETILEITLTKTAENATINLIVEDIFDENFNDVVYEIRGL